MEVKKLTALLVLISAGQFLAGLILLVCAGTGQKPDGMNPAVWICAVLILAASLATIMGIYAVSRYQDQSYGESMRNLESLNGKLREQKHDLMNHFQVVYGLLELEEYEEARAYVRPVFKDIQRLNMALKTALPAVNALLQVKMEAAAQKGIDFYLEVGTTLKGVTIKPWDLCRILANLLDNAMTALEEAEGEKRLVLRMQERREDYRIEISNNGPEIPDRYLPELFRAGFTTKREEGHGQGLAIVQRLVKEAGGSVTVESDAERTAFIVLLPKKEQALEIRRTLRSRGQAAKS